MKRTLDDPTALKYVVAATETYEEETDGELRVRRLCQRYGTTFFGRKWLREQAE